MNKMNLNIPFRMYMNGINWGVHYATSAQEAKEWAIRRWKETHNQLPQDCKVEPVKE